MTKESRQRGFFASERGVKLLKEKMRDMSLTYEQVAEKAGTGEDQVKRLCNPHWKYKVQTSSIDKITKVLELNPEEIIATGNSESSNDSFESTSNMLKKQLSDIVVEEDLEVGDVIQREFGENSSEHFQCTNLKAKSIKIGSLTQEVWGCERSP
jgi:DNA-binding Xre family transcriptional regulator